MLLVKFTQPTLCFLGRSEKFIKKKKKDSKGLTILHNQSGKTSNHIRLMEHLRIILARLWVIALKLLGIKKNSTHAKVLELCPSGNEEMKQDNLVLPSFFSIEDGCLCLGRLRRKLPFSSHWLSKRTLLFKSLPKQFSTNGLYLSITFNTSCAVLFFNITLARFYSIRSLYYILTHTKYMNEISKSRCILYGENLFYVQVLVLVCIHTVTKGGIP